MRKFDSEIWINEKGEWIFRGNEITHAEILKYFKENLKEDANGIYILNVFGELQEMGYVKSQTHPLKIQYVEETAEDLLFHSDSQETISIFTSGIFIDQNEVLFLKRNEQNFLSYQFTRSSLGQLSKYLEEVDGSFFLNFQDLSFEISQKPFPEIKIPAEF